VCIRIVDERLGALRRLIATSTDNEGHDAEAGVRRPDGPASMPRVRRTIARRAVRFQLPHQGETVGMREEGRERDVETSVEIGREAGIGLCPDGICHHVDTRQRSTPPISSTNRSINSCFRASPSVKYLKAPFIACPALPRSRSIGESAKSTHRPRMVFSTEERASRAAASG